MQTYKIEDYPPQARRKPHGYPIDELEKHQCFFVPFGEKESDLKAKRNLQQRIRTKLPSYRESGKSFRTRIEETGIRVWRQL